MASRREPPDSLDFFPTPPWATRALCEHVLKPIWESLGTVWEPACGEGHMAEPLSEFARYVFASDVFDYGYSENIVDFLGEFGAPAVEIDWIVTNPPFNTAIDFALRSLPIARQGVALLCRNSWIEGADRYNRLFRHMPPAIIAPFVERVPMTKGRWDPGATTATAYAWFVWLQPTKAGDHPVVKWIPPGCRQSLTRPHDVERLAVKAETPLLEGTA